VFTKLYCVAAGLQPESKHITMLLRGFSLERGILAGLLLITVGVTFLSAAVLMWQRVRFGHMDFAESLRLVIPAVTCMTLGVQTVFSSFFLSILELKHD
jgi:hypothetical protein